MKTHAQVLVEHAAAATKKARQQKYYWCRLHNGFLDMPLWRVVAAEAKVHLTVVQAFVIRLDSFANEQMPRGDVTYFDPVEFATALDIPSEQAARLFAVLEEKAWIEQDHLNTFYTRNRDSDRDVKPTTDAERKARERQFKGALRELVRQKNFGLITDAELLKKQIALSELRDEGRRGAVTWDEQRAALRELTKVSTGRLRHDEVVTGAGAGTMNSAGASPSQPTKKPDVTTDRDRPEDERPCHDVVVTGGVDRTAQAVHGQQQIAHRDIRDSHARAEQTNIKALGDISGAAASGEAAGLSDGQVGSAETGPKSEAELWLAGVGRDLLVEKMREPPGQVDMLCRQWLGILAGDHAALASLVQAAITRVGILGKHFRPADLSRLIHSDVAQYCERTKHAASGPPLPLKTLLISAGKESDVTSSRDEPTRDRGAVTSDRDAPPELKKAVGDE